MRAPAKTPELRIEAIRRSGKQRISIDELCGFTSTETSVAISRVYRAVCDMKDPAPATKLLEIAVVAIRRSAVIWSRLGDKDDEQTVAQLIAMYDGEANAQGPAALIRAFGDSHQKAAIHKLMAIARNDQVRRAAEAGGETPG